MLLSGCIKGVGDERKQPHRHADKLTFEINIEQVATDALDRMLERQHVNTLAVLDVGALERW